MVLQNGVGQIHNVVHPNPTQKIPQSLKHLQKNISKWFQTHVLEEFFQLLYLNIITCCFFASPWPTGFGPTGVLTKSRFRSSGATEWCWTNSQCSPSKSHPKNPQSLKHLQNYLKPRFWKSCFIEILCIKIIICCFFCFTLTNGGWTHTGVLTKCRFRSSGVTEWRWTNSQCSPSKSHPKDP